MSGTCFSPGALEDSELDGRTLRRPRSLETLRPPDQPVPIDWSIRDPESVSFIVTVLVASHGVRQAHRVTDDFTPIAELLENWFEVVEIRRAASFFDETESSATRKVLMTELDHEASARPSRPASGASASSRSASA